MEAQYKAACRNRSGNDRTHPTAPSPPSYCAPSSVATAGSYSNNGPQVRLPARGAHGGATTLSAARDKRSDVQYQDPERFESYIGRVPSSDQYGSMSQSPTVVDGPRFVHQRPLPAASPPPTGWGGAPPAYHKNITPWSPASGSRPSKGMSSVMEAYLSDPCDPWRANASRWGYYSPR